MKKILLFAFAICLGGIAFAEVWDPPQLDQATCNFFGYPNWVSNGVQRSVKGCMTCPVYDANGHRVTCESEVTNPQHPGVITKDCCWLNTPSVQDPVLGNCYTNGCVLGPNPWSVKCICKLNCAMIDPTQQCYAQCETIQHPNQVPSGYSCVQYQGGNGGNVNNGGNGGNGGNGVIGNNSNKIKPHTPNKPTTPKPAKVTPKEKTKNNKQVAK